ncbi:MAG: putative membrane protein YwzB, partial [Polaribacter sp.]
MKKITLACLLLFCITSFAQQGINYKALIKDGSGVLVSSTPIDVTFIILDGAANVYEETHAPTTDANGIV